MVYIELEEGYTFEEVAHAIKTDDYFAHDETHVMQVESVDALKEKECLSVTQLEVLKAIENSMPVYTFIDFDFSPCGKTKLSARNPAFSKLFITFLP
ncbi:MAG: hypothetical protein BHV68_13500 [Bacteroidales bacterium 43_8]|nr:MAG: hypothetical protein BHV68_13500 [Bacteroidales bacterium 43_8]